MKVVTSVLAPEAAPPLAVARMTDYLELVRPRMTLLVLLTVAAGVYLAAPGHVEAALLVQAIVGTGLVAAGASCVNQFLERNTDALMRRTANRPLPAGRLQPALVLALGTALAIGGLVCLALREPAAAAVAGFTFTSYVFVYTPLKRKTSLNTLVGAVPGALPPVIGWAAVRGRIDTQALALFLVIFLWQVPHFLAIAWIYREQYARAGLKMLPVLDRDGTHTGRQMIGYCLILLPVSLLPAGLGMAGPLYVVGALVLGLSFLRASLGFRRNVSVTQARRVLRASLIYLPLLLLLLLLDVWIAQTWR